ncbi:MAG TPA: D-alanyl-D-alanine carboxypeptidase [Actinomycetota bacterium]
MRARLTRGRVAAVAIAVLMVPLVGASASAEPGTATLDASSHRVTYGEPVSVQGVLSTADVCLVGRSVALQRRPPGMVSWEEVATASTGAGGAFSFQTFPDEIADYRALIAPETRETVSCDEVLSQVVGIDVRAAVTLALSGNPVPASGCARLRIDVLPTKPGQEVLLQRRRGGSWTTEETLILGPDSEASRRTCMTWSEIGRHRFRARWPRQDESNLAATSSPVPMRVVKAAWMKRIDAIAAPLRMGVSVRERGAFLFRRGDTGLRTPASNQKLLLSMALLDTLGPDRRLATRALSRRPRNGVVRGHLWIVGSGDPEVGPSKLRRLAARIEEAGVRRITGGVRGSTALFARDWWAPGWRGYFPRTVIALPTALTFRGNVAGGRHVRDPERRAALALTKQLRRRGVRVAKPPGMGRHPSGRPELTRVESRPLSGILTITNHASSNFWAEVLTKGLAVARREPPGTIAKGAGAVAAWVRANGGRSRSHDGSGLSYANRTTPESIARLLGRAEGETWGARLRSTLPTGGVGTLSGRLHRVPVRAKTGTLSGISALSGWVESERTATWVEFSLLSQGVSTTRAKAAEDRIVRILWRNAR